MKISFTNLADLERKEFQLEKLQFKGTRLTNKNIEETPFTS